MAAIASAATAAGSAARRACGGMGGGIDVTGVLRSMVHAQTGHSVLSRRRRRCRDTPQSHPRGLTRKRRPLYSAGFAAPAFRPATEGPCGGTGRRARLKIEFRKECWFDSGQGHQPSLASRASAWRANFDIEAKRVKAAAPKPAGEGGRGMLLRTSLGRPTSGVASRSSFPCQYSSLLACGQNGVDELVRGDAAALWRPMSAAQRHRKPFGGLPAGVEIMVAETDRIIGFAAFSAIYPGPGLRSGLFMKELFVTAGSRGQGCGKALILVSCTRGRSVRAQPRRLDRRPNRCRIAELLFRAGGAGAARKGFLSPYRRCAGNFGGAQALTLSVMSQPVKIARTLVVLW